MIRTIATNVPMGTYSTKRNAHHFLPKYNLDLSLVGVENVLNVELPTTGQLQITPACHAHMNLGIALRAFPAAMMMGPETAPNHLS